MEAFIDVTKLGELFESYGSANGKTVDKLVFHYYLCNMTCHSQLEAINWIRYITETQGPYIQKILTT